MALSITCRDNLHFCSCKLSIFVEYHTLSLHTSVTPSIHLFIFGSPFYVLARPKIARKLNSFGKILNPIQILNWVPLRIYYSQLPLIFISNLDNLPLSYLKRPHNDIIKPQPNIVSFYII